MRKKLELIIGVTLLLATTPPAFAQAPLWKATPKAAPVVILHNSDVLTMVKSGMKTSQIIARIRNSCCTFDVFPPVLQDLRRRGVRSGIAGNGLSAYWASESSFNDPPIPQAERSTVKLQKVRQSWSKLCIRYPPQTFRLAAQSLFGGGRFCRWCLVIPRGTVARQNSPFEKGGKLGRGGALTWQMESIRAVDGTQIGSIVELCTRQEPRRTDGSRFCSNFGNNLPLHRAGSWSGI
jgi:hypothetical protein